MKKGYKSLITLLSMMFLFSSFSFAQEVAEILWEDNFNDTATDPSCLIDVGWMYYGENDGLFGSIVEQTDEGTAFFQVGSFGGVLGAVLFQSNGCPEIDTADSERGHMLLVDSSKGAPNIEITFNVNFKTITSSFFSCAARMVQRDLEEDYPDSDPTEEGAYQLFISPLENTIAIARVIGVEEGGSEMSFLDPGSWQYLTPPTDFEIDLNVPYWIKFYMYENTFKVKIWEGALDDEEDVWLLEGTDDSDSARVSGTFIQFALLAPLDASSTDQLELDNITVRSTGNTVGVEDNVATLPDEFMLYANYPNPFNPTTNIQFALPATSNVKLTVVNALGQVVSELVNGQMSAGIHNVTWNAANMTSGIYFYRVEANGFVQTRKMLLLK